MINNEEKIVHEYDGYKLPPLRNRELTEEEKIQIRKVYDNFVDELKKEGVPDEDILSFSDFFSE